MENNFRSTGLLVLLWKWRVHLLVILFLSGTGAFIFSGPQFIKPMYSSEAILYPSNLIPYSTESPTEQMLQLLQSSEIRDSIIAQFDLMKHYEIDPAKTRFPRTELYDSYRSNIKFSQTEYESVRIEARDVDAQLAAKMVGSIIRLLNMKARGLQREKSMEIVVIEQNQLDSKRKEIDSLSATLKTITDHYNIIDYRSQVSAITRNYYRALAERKSGSGLEEMRQMMTNLREQGEKYNELKGMIDRANINYNEIKISLEVARKDVGKELSYSNTVAYPMPEERKSYPSRLLIVIMTMASTFVLTLVIIALSENLRNINFSNTPAQKNG